MSEMHRLNAEDHGGLIHAVRIDPSELTLGVTRCRRFFTFPLFCHFKREVRWEGTEAMVTCLMCICP